MSFNIAVAGKGGTGKTTFSALLIKKLRELNLCPVLAVDADPNSNLNEHLEMEYNSTVSDVREEVRDETKIPKGISKPDYINLKLSEVICEGDGVDLIVMGRPEGKGCYCYVNELLRNFISKISKNYKYVVMDNEAGMEHLSRRTTDNVDILFVMVCPDRISIDSGKKIVNMVQKQKINIKKTYYIINLVNDEGIIDRISLRKDEIAGIIPEIEEIKNTVPVPVKTKADKEIEKIIKEYIL